jgi:uncharacterized protein
MENHNLPTIPDADHPTVVLSEDECWDLLMGTTLGRLGLSVRDQPEVYPVNFLAHDRRILLRTVEGTKLAELTVNNKVALETDRRSAHSVWSVMVKGKARILETEDEIAAARRLPLRTWTAAVKTVFVEITPTEVTGRRIALGPEPDDL